MENYQEAILCYKYSLSMSWAVDSVEVEMACYRELCASRYHLGHVEKSKFYDDRFLSGFSEPPNSQTRQTAVQQCITKNSWLTEKIERGSGGLKNRRLDRLGLARRNAKAMRTKRSHINSLFSETMLDFSLIKPDYLKLLTNVDLRMKEGKRSGKYEKI